jgi:hypothetical protein
MNVSSTSTTVSSIATPEQRTACAALATALEAELRKLPRSAKWWERQPYTDALGWLSCVVQFGAYGGRLGYTSHADVLALAAAHGVEVAPAPRKACDERAQLLRVGLHITEQRRPYLRG